MPLQVEKVKHYKILRLIGKGGMGEVYLAQDTILDRKVAIKFLSEKIQEDPKARKRLLKEAKAAAALDHPFICKIYETGEVDGNAFIVMEYIEGIDLMEKLEKEPLPLKESLRVFLEIAEALEKAHEKGIVHRDLKPPNIMLTPQGHVKVMDFGLAKRIFPEGDELTRTLTQASITEEGTIVGTLAYMSPEQARGDLIDWRSDIFSLGVLLHEMISGKPPFKRPSPAETLSAILRDSPPSVRIKQKKVNPAIDRILQKSLAKKPTERYQSVADLVSDIQKTEKEAALERHLLFRGWPMIAASIVLVAVLVTGILLLTRRGRVSPPEIAPEPMSVLVADFQNQTGDPVFDGALEQALSIGLEGAPFISIYNRAQARKLGNQLDPDARGRLNNQTAQLVSRREGIHVVVSASIELSGDGYTIKAWALDPVESEKVSEASETIKTKAEVLKAADNLAAKLRSDLGGVPPESTQALAGETFTTSSLEAMKAYAHAQELASLGKDEEAIQEYLKAVEEDPKLGRAYAGLAVIYRNRGHFQEANKYYQMAMSLIDNMTEREKYRTRGGYYFFNRNYQKAIEEYNALRKLFPADTAAFTNLPLAYFYVRKMERAFEEGRQAVELDPKRITPRYNLAWYAMGAGKFDIANQESQTVLELNPKFEEGYVCLALSELGQGRTAQAVEAYESLEPLSSYGASLAATGLADLAFYEGRLSDAQMILKKSIDLDLENGWKYYAAHKYLILAQTYVIQRKKSLAIDAADRAIAMSKNESVTFSAAHIYLQTGQENKAQSLASALSEQLQVEPRIYAKLIESEIKKMRGNIPEAIKLIREAQALLDTWLGRFCLGLAYLEAQAFTEAHSEFELCLKRQGEAASIFLDDLPSFRYVPPVYYFYGRAQEGLGSPAASESYQKFLTIKEKSKQDPLVEDARRRLNTR